MCRFHWLQRANFLKIARYIRCPLNKHILNCKAIKYIWIYEELFIFHELHLHVSSKFKKKTGILITFWSSSRRSTSGNLGKKSLRSYPKKFLTVQIDKKMLEVHSKKEMRLFWSMDIFWRRIEFTSWTYCLYFLKTLGFPIWL